MTDDYFKAKKQAEIFEQDLQDKDQEMYELKHELIALRLKIEETEKKQQEADAAEAGPGRQGKRAGR